MQEAMTKSDAPLHVKYLQTMVECLCMLGKVAACGAIIWCVVSLLLDYLYLLLKIPLCMENWRYMLQCYIMDCRLAASDQVELLKQKVVQHFDMLSAYPERNILPRTFSIYHHSSTYHNRNGSMYIVFFYTVTIKIF